MAVKRERVNLTNVAEDDAEKLAAVTSFAAPKLAKPEEPTKEKPAWVTPSIQMTKEQLHLLRAVALARSQGKGRVQISDVVRRLIETQRPALEAEAGWQKGTTA
jgi:hypothetical protein